MPTRYPFLALGLLACSTLAAQQACPPMQAPAPDPSKLLFTPQQETELGEIVRQQLESDFGVIEDPEVTGYLDRVGQRVAAHLPDVGLHYQFLLYDQPEINAFGMVGGRIYVSRKLVAFLRSEDELAGVLGHEMGHLASRQQSLEYSDLFRDVLGLKTVPEDEDLFALYNQLLDSMRLKKRRSGSSGEEEKGQAVADQLGVQAVVRAGYSPQAYPDALDRILETKGKTGNWVSDMFGATKPNSRRLREALKDVSNLPSACVEAASPTRSGDFQNWQAVVLRYKGLGHAEQLPGLLSRKTLNSPLRADIENFRFSPDGKYLLAQDETGIYVLTRDPLKFVFRIDAEDSQPAQFSPDGKQIVFFSSHFRVETWDIDRQEQISLTDVPVIHGCRQTSLSPDAKFLACFDDDLTLTLIDVASGETLFQKDHFYEFEAGIDPWSGFAKYLYFLLHPEVVVLRFSPDARYFAASSGSGESVVFDLSAQKKISVPLSIHTAMAYAFTFLGPDRIVGVDQVSPQKSPVAEFPSGKVLDRVPLGSRSLVGATNLKFLLMRPVTGYPVGAYDLTLKKIVAANRSSAMDVWDDFVVSERLNGEIALYKIGENNATGITQLPVGNLGSLRALAASPDLQYLAIANHTRGGLWNLSTNMRVLHVRAFQSAFYNSNTTFFLDFPTFEKSDRELVVASPVTGQSKGRPVDKDDDVTFFGDVLFRIKYGDKNRRARKNFDFEVVDIVNQQPLWYLHFPKEGPAFTGLLSSGIVVLRWLGASDGLKAEVARDARLQSLWDKEKLKAGDYFFEALDSRKGTVLGAAVVHTGKFSFIPESVEAVGDWLVVADNRTRVLLFSLATGEQKARWFGYRPQLSANGRRLCLINGRGHLVVYDLQTLKPLEDLYFANHISAHLLSADGTKMLVLTNDHTAFQFDLSTGATKSASN